MYALIEVENGIFEGIRLCTRKDRALEAGKSAWAERTGSATMHEHEEITAEHMTERDPDYHPKWGGVSRGHVMHWWSDDLDVVVEEVEPDHQTERGPEGLYNPKVCEHKPHEDCMICDLCGLCSETLDADDICANCNSEES